MPLFFSGNPLNGGAGNDFLLDYDGNAAAGAQNGGDGNDVILGDFGFFNTQFAGSSYNSTATALNVDASGVWYTDNRAYIATGSTPHTSIYIEGRAGEQRYISFIATAGATISLDIDFAGNIGTGWDSTLTLLDSGGTQLAFNDDSALDGGSFSGLDSKLTFTATYSGTYYVRVGTFGGNFVGGETGILNISVSGHVASGNPFIGADTIDGGNGNDVLYGGSGTGNTINGGLGDDRIISNGFDNVNAGDGNDTVFAGNGSSAETLDGGLGTDLLDTTSWTGDYVVNLATGVTNFGENFTNFENLTSGIGNDTLTGTTGANVIRGGAGDDVINSNGGVDTIFGDAGNDTITSSGAGSYSGGDGDDIIIAGDTSPTSTEALDGGNGIDTLNTTGYNGLYDVNLVTGATNYPGSTGGESFTNFENIITGNGNTTVLGTTGNNIITTGSGNDTVTGNGGTDTVNTGLGNDIIFSGGDGVYNAGDGDDTVFAGITTVSETLDGGNGIDLLNTTSWAGDYVVNLATGVTNFGESFTNFENLTTGAGNDTLTGTTGVNIINGGTGNDTINGGGGVDTIHGDAGDDIITSTGAGEFIFGDAGNDTLFAGIGADNLDGGADIDTLNTTLFSGNYVVNLTTGLTNFGSESFLNFENLTSGAGNDTLTGTSGANIINGGAGNDTIDGVGGADTIHGDAGDDILTSSGSNNFIFGDDGNDTVFAGLGTPETLDGGNGIDTLNTTSFGSNYTVNLASGTTNFAGESFTNFENLVSGAGNDTLLGTAGANDIDGGAGTDYLIGQAGDDTLRGGGVAAVGQGNTLQGGTGNDNYYVSVREDSTLEFAGEGFDTVYTTFNIYPLQNNVEQLIYTDTGNHGAGVGNTLDNILVGNVGVDDLFGREGDDTIYGGSGAANTLLGQAGNDLYVSQASGDTVIEFAGEGVDWVYAYNSSFTLRPNVENLYNAGGTNNFVGVGTSEDNTIVGGGLIDFLNGLAGNDIINGGSGSDQLQGGAGADQFRYNVGETGLDRILDFTSGQDKIALSGANFVHTAVIDFIQTGAPAPTSTNSTFLHDVNSGIVSYDADGTGAGAAVQLAQLNPGLTLAAGDFIFF